MCARGYPYNTRNCGEGDSFMRKMMCLCGILLLLSGCTSAQAAGREPEDTVLAQVIGVDVDGRGIVVTAAGQDGEETAVVSASGETLEEAFAALPTAGEKYVSLTNVSHILLGDGIDTLALLRYVVEDPDMSYMARVWAGSFAGGLMEDLREAGLERFRTLEQSGVETVTVKTALAELISEQKTEIPALSVPDGELEVVGKLYFEVT